MNWRDLPAALLFLMFTLTLCLAPWLAMGRQ